MYNYIPIKLIVNEEESVNKDLLDRSSFFTGAFPIKRDCIIGCAVAEMRRDASLDIWKEIPPQDGKYEFEIAVQLPFFLPKHENHDEYAISIKDRVYVISNRHCEVILDGKHEEFFLVHYLARHQLARALQQQLNQVIMARSLVMTKLSIEAPSASNAIETYFGDWLSILNRDLPNMITAMRYHLDGNTYEIPECNDIGKFCPIYVLCKGKDLGVPLRFAAHIAAYQMQPFCRFSCDLEEIETFCAGAKTVDVSKILLDRATLLLRSGELSMACVLACTACEIFLTAHAHDELVLRGMPESNKKKKEAFNDIYLSHLLNLVSYFVFDRTNDSRKSIFSKINALRKLRNDIVHEGKWLTFDSRNVVEQGITAIRTLRAGNSDKAQPDGSVELNAVCGEQGS